MKLLIKKKDEKDLHWPQGLAIYIVCPITHNYKTLAVLNRLFGLWFGMVTGLKIFFLQNVKVLKVVLRRVVVVQIGLRPQGNVGGGRALCRKPAML